MFRFVLWIPKLYVYFSSSWYKFSYHCYYKWCKLISINFTVLHACLNLSIVNIMKWGLIKGILFDICCKITFWNKLLSLGIALFESVNNCQSWTWLIYISYIIWWRILDHEISQLDLEIVKQCIIVYKSMLCIWKLLILTTLCHYMICNTVLGLSVYHLKQVISGNKINSYLLVYVPQIVEKQL